MEMMYNTSLQLHFGLVLFWMGVIAFNMAMVQFATQADIYVRRARIAMPFSVMAIFAVAFTGTVMMAAKHLDFTIENIAMIVTTVLLVIMESRRYKTLRHLRIKAEDALALYRPFALKLLAAEMAVTLFMTVWMSLL